MIILRRSWRTKCARYDAGRASERTALPPRTGRRRRSGVRARLPVRHAACRAPEGITVAGQRRIHTGFAEICAILGYLVVTQWMPRTGVQYPSLRPLTMAAPPGARAPSPGVAAAGPLLPLAGSGLRCHKVAVRPRARAPGPRA